MSARARGFIFQCYNQIVKYSLLTGDSEPIRGLRECVGNRCWVDRCKLRIARIAHNVQLLISARPRELSLPLDDANHYITSLNTPLTLFTSHIGSHSVVESLLSELSRQLILIRPGKLVKTLLLNFLDIDLLHVVAGNAESEGVLCLSRAELTWIFVMCWRWMLSYHRYHFEKKLTIWTRVILEPSGYTEVFVSGKT